MKKGFLHAGMVAGLILILDLWSKARAESIWQFAPWSPTSWFSLTYSENHGIAFGIPFGGMGVLIMTTLLIGGVIGFAMTTMDMDQKINRWALGLVLGGAIGNLIDRINYGVVRDFIQVGWWPVFNVADMAIMAGVFLLLSIAYKK